MRPNVVTAAFLVLALTGSRSWARNDPYCPLVNTGCECEASTTNGGHVIWCPTNREHRYQLTVRTGQLILECNDVSGHQITSNDMLYDLRNITAGERDTLMIKHCPIMKESYAKLVDALGITKLKEFILYYDDRAASPLSADLFNGLVDLISLRLTSLHISNIDENVFRGLADLKTLELSTGTLTSLPANIFQGMESLKFLHLRENQLRELQQKTFAPLKSLESLSLNLRSFKKLSGNFFEDLRGLVQLDITGLNLTKRGGDGDLVPEGTFDGLTKLVNFTISGRGLELAYKNAFGQMKALKKFYWTVYYCSEGNCAVNLTNGLMQDKPELEEFSFTKAHHVNVVLGENFFRNCPKLRRVEIAKVGLQNLPETTFSDSPLLQEIDLSQNGIDGLSEKVFAGLRKLKQLYVNDNQIKKLGQTLFSDLRELEELNLSRNQIDSIERSTFTSVPKLKWLNLDDNELTFRTSLPYMLSMGSLQVLTLANNKIGFQHFPSDWTTSLLQLRSLDLSRNQLGPRIDALDLHFQQSEIVVNLSGNNIETIDFTTALKIPTGQGKTSKPKATIFLGQNPLNCDCTALNLAQFTRKDLVSNQVYAWFQMKTSNLTCAQPSSLASKTFNSVGYEDFACNFPSNRSSGQKCPTGCHCKHVPYHNSTVIDCEHAAMDKLPSFVPMLIDAPNVVMNMSYNDLNSISGAKSTTENWESVSKLVLTGNHLSDIKPDDLPAALNSLYLDSNDFGALDEATYGAFAAMQGGIRLGNNSYACTCESIALHNFVRNFRHLIEDHDQVTVTCEGEERHILDWSKRELCPRIFMTFVFPSLMAILVLALATTVLVMYFKEPIMIYIYSHKTLRRLFNEDLVDSDKPYDAFISYSNEDREYVEGKLVPGLENPPDGQPQFKCLVHVRDFDLGLNIMQQIADAVDSSRRTVIVLSKNFCRSPWYQHEFQLAHARKRVVVIVHGEIPTTEEMGKQMHDYVATNTYLQDTDPWFWEKLRYALPHKSEGHRLKWLQPFRRRRTTDTMQLIQNGSARVSPTGAGNQAFEASTVISDEQSSVVVDNTSSVPKLPPIQNGVMA